MATIAFSVINLTPRRLLCIKPEFGIGFAALYIATTSDEERDQRRNHEQERRPIYGLSIHEPNLSSDMAATPRLERHYNDSAIL